eukprot:GFUD01038483.1.p1 GENE.GFUD01038483.1~~GFUD01038483.1.p1  ORF type:complete len:414 (+),score=155.40 GFUD01038483.1:69-1310(+)
MSPLARHLLGGLAGAAGGLVAGRYIFSQDVTYQEPAPPLPALSVTKPLLSSRATQILAFGQPAATVPSPLVYRNHVLEYDSARRVPKWVAEHLTKDLVKQEVASRKGVNFSPDPVVPEQFRSTNQDYWGSGWSRGHMAPAGNNKHCQESMRDTFYLTNVVPQDIDNNGGYWNRLEIWVRGLTEHYQDVWVISGPLWLPQEPVKEEATATVSVENAQEPVKPVDNPIVTSSGETKVGEVTKKVRPPRPAPKMVSYPVLGPNNVAVPTHLYKVVLVTDPLLDRPLLGTFVVPNIPVGDKHLAEFKVELGEVERGVGVTFHPELDREKVGDLCIQSGCNMQDYKKFQQFFWTRRLNSPWNMRSLERDWAEAKKKGVINSELEVVYNESRARLEFKEREKQEQEILKVEEKVIAPGA